jgi:hypothetical protein
MVSLFRLLSIYVVPLFILIPIIAGIIRYKRLAIPLKLIFYLMLFYALISTIISVRWIHHTPSKFYTNINSFVDFPLISAFYILILNRKWKTTVIIIAIVYALFWVADLFIEANSTNNIYPIIYESIFIMLYAATYMNQQTQTNIEKRWGENSYNWVNSGFFIYIASTLLMFIFYDLMLKIHVNMMAFLVLGLINYVMLALEYILIAIGFNKCRQ